MKRRSLILILAVICLIVALSYLLFNYNGKVQTQEIPTSQENAQAKPSGEVMVIPEVPLGILGSISALAIAIGFFTLIKKKN